MEWFCLNVKLRHLGFLILQISHIFKLSLMSTNFVMDFIFGSGLPPLVSRFELKKDIEITCKYNPHNLFTLTDVKNS